MLTMTMMMVMMVHIHSINIHIIHHNHRMGIDLAFFLSAPFRADFFSFGPNFRGFDFLSLPFPFPLRV